MTPNQVDKVVQYIVDRQQKEIWPIKCALEEVLKFIEKVRNEDQTK